MDQLCVCVPALHVKMWIVVCCSRVVVVKLIADELLFKFKSAGCSSRVLLHVIGLGVRWQCFTFCSCLIYHIKATVGVQKSETTLNIFSRKPRNNQEV